MSALDVMEAEARALLAVAGWATTRPWEIDVAPGLCGHDVDRYHVIAAPEAAVDVVALVPRVEGAEADAAYLTHAANTAPDLARQVLSLAAALRTERAAREAAEAQHAADVAAAVAGERERIAAECKRVVRENTRPWELAEEIADALTAQHAGDVAAAVAGERERAVAVCRAVADGWERASVTAKVDTGLALIRAEGATECADALAAPTGGGE